MSSLYYTTGKLPLEDTGSIYIGRYYGENNNNMPSKAKFPREEGYLVGTIIEKMGLGNLLGKCLKMHVVI